MAQVDITACEARHRAIDNEFHDIKSDIQRLWDKVDRLPAWAVWAMTFLGGIAGGAIGWSIRSAFIL